jgi:hypothetical protein
MLGICRGLHCLDLAFEEDFVVQFPFLACAYRLGFDGDRELLRGELA